jgi:hypothetical protein
VRGLLDIILAKSLARPVGVASDPTWDGPPTAAPPGHLADQREDQYEPAPRIRR